MPLVEVVKVRTHWAICRGDKSPQRFASCDTFNFVKIIVAGTEFCRYDQLHEFKPV